MDSVSYKLEKIDTENVPEKIDKDNKNTNLKAGFLFAGIALISAGAGFGASLGTVKRREREIVSSAGFGAAEMGDAFVHEAATRLAMRALGWGTLLAVTGVSTIAYAFWKLSGARNFEDFRLKMGAILPTIPKTKSPGKSEFGSLQEFIDYVSKNPRDA